MQQYLGLSQTQVNESEKLHGSNIVAKNTSFSPLTLLLTQFASPVMVVLVVAGGISFFFHGVSDAIVVWSAVLLNGFLGFYQEYRAEKSLEALEKIVEVNTEVIRDGKRLIIPIEKVVVGDIVVVKSGDKIPADCIVLEATSLATNEAMLSGESVAIVKIATENEEFEKCSEKQRVYMGTVVVAGLGVVRVAKVGRETSMGRIATTLATTKRTPTLLQQEMARFAQILTVVIAVIATLLFVVGMWRGMPVREIFLVSVAVAVSAIPEGLAITLTVILALGMQRLLRRRGLVRKLLVAESLGRVSVVCADKTGTLTKGEMKVVGAEGNKLRLAEAGILGGDMADPIETAVVEWANKECGIEEEGCEIKNWQRVVTVPFDPSKKYGASVSKKAKEIRVIMRGAPEVVLKHCKLTKKQEEHWQKRFTQLANQGYRLIAIAEYRENLLEEKLEERLNQVIKGKKFEYLGLIIMEDPVRENVKQEIANLVGLEVDFRVITGDFAETALYVMKQLGLEVGNKIIKGEEFRLMNESEQERVIKETVLFARFSPDDKLKVVEILQRQGQVVAMMGDGVNDAPALKRADVGIVVSTAAEVSKETADMVLLDDQFGTVVAGIEEGRSIFERIKRVVQYLLSDSFSEVVIVTVSLLVGLPLPITAAQILWINLANDTFPAMALSFDPVDRQDLTNRQISKLSGLLDNQSKILIGVVSLVSGLLVMGMFWWSLSEGHSEIHARTLAFAFLGINTLFSVFVIRNFNKPFWKTNLFNNWFLWGGVGAGVIMQISAVYFQPLQRVLGTNDLVYTDWFMIAGGTGVVVMSIEVIKLLTKRFTTTEVYI